MIPDLFEEDKIRVDNFNLQLLNTQIKMKVTDLKGNELISCASEAERVRIAHLLHKSGLKWCNGESYLGPLKGVVAYPFYYKPQEGVYISFSDIDIEYYTVYDSSKFRDEDYEPSMHGVLDELMRELGFEREFTSASTGAHESTQEARPFVQTSNGTITGENLKITTDQPQNQSDFNLDVYQYTLSALLEDGVIPEKAVGIALAAGRRANDPESII